MPTIKLLTFNTKMLSGPGGETRAEKIARAILKNKYDIICLQEVFDEDIREIFVNEFKDRFQTIIPKCSDGDIFNDDSGLFFASRFPMRGYGRHKGWGFEEYDQHAGWDRFGDKGVFGARLNLDSVLHGVTLLLFNTHLQSHEEHAEIRRTQFAQLSDFIYGAMRRVSKPSQTAVVLCGDMNVAGDVGDEYSRMMRLLGDPRDSYRESHPDQKGFTWDAKENLNMIPSDDHDQQRLDYIFYFNSFTNAAGNKEPLFSLTSERVEVQVFGTDKNNRLSDHFAVEAYIALPGSGAVKKVTVKKKRSGVRGRRKRVG